MKSRFVAGAVVASMMFAALSWTGRALADDAAAAGPVKIAVCDTVKVLTDIQESKDVMAKWQQDAKDLQNEADVRQSKLQTQQKELALILSTSPGYADKADALVQADADYQAWFQAQKLILGRKQKMQEQQLFGKIVAAVTQVAQAKGISVVLNSSFPQFPEPEKMDANAFYQVVLMHNCLYASGSLDITTDVVVALDKTYNAKQ